jgi:hypothetical protein
LISSLSVVAVAAQEMQVQAEEVVQHSLERLLP